MRIANYAALALALVLPPALHAQAERETLATCRATLDGGSLTTVIEFPDGYRVTAPWQVVGRENGNGNGDGGGGLLMQVTLDRIVERNPDTGEEFSTPFPNAVQAEFEGSDEEELVAHAARMWCLTVLKAQETHPPTGAGGDPHHAPAAPAGAARPATIG
jgi:hypothetical protein